VKRLDTATQANLIKIGAVLTAIPRWVTALLWAEGFALPAAWLPWWVPASAAVSVAMAAVEGFAFAFAFSVWASRKDAKALLGIASVTAALFVAVLTPSIAAGVRGVEIGAVLRHDGVLLLWSVAVAASTIGIVISTGYAQRIAADNETAVAAVAHGAPNLVVTKPALAALSGDILPALPESVPSAALPVAKIADWRGIVASQNGDGRNLSPDDVRRILAESGRGAPTDKTVKRWAEETGWRAE